MFTPWGTPKQTHRLEQGIAYIVATRGSGLMLSRGYAERRLSSAARQRAVRFGEYYAYAADGTSAAAMSELLHLRSQFAQLGIEPARQPLVSS
jgi:phage portal protein BeeE